MQTNNRSPIKSVEAPNHGSTVLVIGADIKYQVYTEILIYHLILVIGYPFENNFIILLIRRRNAAIMVNT